MRLLKALSGFRKRALVLVDEQKRMLARFHEDADEAKRAFYHFNGEGGAVKRNFDAELIERAVEFGYLSWPRKIAQDVRGKDILDVGCGTGLHAVGYVVVGCRTYTGMDPKVDLDSDRSKDLRAKEWSRFGWTPREMMERIPNVSIVPGTFEVFTADQTFDLAILHNVTEHLLDIETVFAGMWERIRPDGEVLFNHHNFYCWNGHHRPPKWVAEIDPDDEQQKNYVDWAHLDFDPPPGHAFLTKLNRIRLDDLRALTDRYFDIYHWEEIPIDSARGADRLTPEIRQRHAQYSARELTVQNVLCRAKKRETPLAG